MIAIKKAVEGVMGKWDLFVYSIQLAINNKVSKRLNTPPFNIMFGRRMNGFETYNEETGETRSLTKEEVDLIIKELQEVVLPAIKEKMKQVIKVQKRTFDNKHVQKDIPENSFVRIKIHPKLQT